MLPPQIRSAQATDTIAIAELYNGKDYSSEYARFVELCVQNYPSAIAHIGTTCVGFAYCNRFAPDVLELENLYIHSEFRNRGIGTAVLRCIEEQASHRYAAIILVNSSLYVRAEPKRRATDFYLRNGYSLSFFTEHSRIFTKPLK